MNIVLLSGGSGKRLWPLSNDIRSKQFIKIFKKADGQYESMVQRVYRQIKQVDAKATVTIATSKTQVSAINNQLGGHVGISVEPCRRDTFPAIALATAYLVDVLKVPATESVVVCPVDPYVEDDYFEALKGLAAQADKGEANLVLMGIEPTYPSEKYGYIIPASKAQTSMVSTFKEKPSKQVAEEYIAQGALWNGGVFAYKLQYVMDIAHQLIDFTDYHDLYAKYDTLTKISFDYAVVEKEEKIQVQRFAGQWKDLGTWNTLTESMGEPVVGKGVLNDTCSGVSIVNEMDVPVLAMGLKDVVISASPEGILVSDKEQSSYIKPFVEKFEQQVMFAEKSWGSYRVLQVEPESMTVLVTLNPGHSMNYHSHAHRSEVWTVLSGYGHVIIDDVTRNIKAGDVVTMPIGCKHTVFADTELKLIEVQLGQAINVADKVKHDFRPDAKCFGGADIRGIYPTQVNEELAYRIGRNFRTVLIKANGLWEAGTAAKDQGMHEALAGEAKAGTARLKVAVGHDIRLSGPRLQKALVRGLQDAGCDVVDIGQCGTEMIYFATAHLKLAGGIMITASHNPKDYNGFKLVGAEAKPISKDNGLQELEQLCQHVPPAVKGAPEGKIEKYDIMPEYVQHLLSYVDVSRLKQLNGGKPLKVVANTGNGAAGPIINELAKHLPFEFVKVFNEPDGNFPHGVPNPIINENREATAKVVRETGADVGIAWDGDFDRCFMFDETGKMIEGYYMVGFLAEAFLQKNAGAKIIHDPRVYWNTQSICAANSGEAVLCRSGHSFIKAKMREADAIYGGEMSAHHYFRDFAYCDSGMIPWLLVLELLCQSGKQMSQMMADRMDKFPCSGEINSKVESVETAAEIISKVEAKYAALPGAQVDYTDGLSVAYPEWRFNLRKSNTEPVIRLNVETRGDKKLLDARTKELLDMIRG